MHFLIGLLALALFTAEPKMFAHTTLGLGSVCEIKFYAETESAGNAALTAAIRQIELTDSLFSLFSDNSEVTKLNKQKTIRASAWLLEAVRKSLKISSLSGGAFDISVYPLLEVWGFYDKKKLSSIPGSSVLKKARAKVGFRRIVVSADSIRLPADMKIDLGGIGQGFAADLVINEFKKHGITSALVNIGGEVAAMGRKPDGTKWQVGIKDPRHRGITRVVALEDQALSTSGDYEKFFMLEGKRYAHIIDPRTGMPAQGCISVTILAQDAAFADALATAVFVLGPAEGRTLIGSLENVGAIIYTEQDGKAHETYVKGL